MERDAQVESLSLEVFKKHLETWFLENHLETWWCLETWFSGEDGKDGLMVGPNDLRGLFQP